MQLTSNNNSIENLNSHIPYTFIEIVVFYYAATIGLMFVNKIEVKIILVKSDSNVHMRCLQEFEKIILFQLALCNMDN